MSAEIPNNIENVSKTENEFENMKPIRMVRDALGALVMTWDKSDPDDPRPSQWETTLQGKNGSDTLIGMSHYVVAGSDKPVIWKQLSVFIEATQNEKQYEVFGHNLINIPSEKVRFLLQAVNRGVVLYTRFKESTVEEQKKEVDIIDNFPVSYSDDEVWQKIAYMFGIKKKPESDGDASTEEQTAYKEGKQRPEIKVYLDHVQGWDYRIPSIFYNGFNYQVNNVSLPQNWHQSIPKLAEFNREQLLYGLELLCKPNDFSYDIQTVKGSGLLYRVHLSRGKWESSLSLITSGDQAGKYVIEKGGTDDLAATFVYLQFMARYFEIVMGDTQKHAYPQWDGLGMGCSFDMNIPEKIWQSDQILMPSEERIKFKSTATAIAAQFKQKGLQDLIFDNRGLLKEIQLDKVDGACKYVFKERWGYQPNNVDSIFDAAALHAITAAYINRLLDMGEQS